MKNLRLVSVGLCAIAFTGCSRTVTAPPMALKDTGCRADQNVGLPPFVGKDAESQAAEMRNETDISEQCVQAWRLALKGDEKGSLAILDGLEKKYPNVSTVHMMRGQILERLGKKKEAVKYYQQAVTQGEFSTLRIFKLAEALRTTGDAKEAIPRYRKLISLAPNFVEGRLGLAKALCAVDPHSQEARDQVSQVLQSNPDDKEAQKMQKEMAK